jgi:regulatory protein
MSKYITKQEALTKLQRYCAYQDRCHQEVRSKLLDLGIRGFDLEEVIASLIEENFLNEERFARSFVRGKFRMKQWGRRKIEQELKKKNIPAYCVKMGFTEIEEDEYWHTLLEVLKKKNTTTKASKLYERKQKLAQYGIRKGFESHLVWKAVNELELEE